MASLCRHGKGYMIDHKGERPREFPQNAVQLVRNGQQMQLQLSQMADQKASMLMGASLVVFTLAVGQLRSGNAMLAPVVLLATTAFVSALFAILSVLPTITRTRDGLVGPDANLLFFGIFTTLPEDQFIDRVLDHMESDETTYRAMLRDMYQAGNVLARKKYRYLGYAYRAFLTGMVMTAMAAVLELATGRLI